MARVENAPRLPEAPRLPPAMPRSGVSAEARLALRQLLGDNERRLADAFRAGADARALTRIRSLAVEHVVVHVWRSCVGDPTDCALFAVGGFGRGFLFPYSDVDLFVLIEPGALARHGRVLEAFFACLWDLGLKPGHAVRELAECRELASRDVSVFTNLLDARRLAGSSALAQALAEVPEDPDLWPPADYLAAKRAEQIDRHARFNDTAYNLEPNLKEGPGGLRTLDLLRWLGRRVTRAVDFDAMVVQGVLDPTERAALDRSEATLRRYRYALHLAAGRAEERLLFDYQRTLAAELGYEDEHEKNLAVEQFMQGYYRAATVVERLGAQVTERFMELLDPPAGPPRAIDRDFVAVGSRLEPRSATLFERRPRATIEAFALLLDHPELRSLSAEAMRRLQRALARHGGDFADDRYVLAAFLALLRRGAPSVAALAAMNRHGVLAALLPTFRRVVGRMQYDLFHVYTVDEHTLRVLRNVARFAEPAAREEFPIACGIFGALDKPELLLLAAMFHDIAKGRGGDHSVLGEEEARAFCDKLGLDESDIDLIAWLVRWHLIMSVTAQRQDITDPDVVHRFAVQVEDLERLDHLYLLTIADIAGTNPKLWNAWKDRLLADLYVATRYALRAGLERPPNAPARIAACREAALALLSRAGVDAARAERIWTDFPEASFLRHRPEQIAWQTRSILAHASDDVPIVAVDTQSTRGGSEVFIRTRDRDGLFAAITATLDRLRCSVVEARILSAHAMAFDTFVVLDADTQAPLDAARAAELETELAAVLSEETVSARLVRRNLPRRLRHFRRAPRVEFTHSDQATQLALVCGDQPGLLAQVAQTLRDARVRVRDARIATFGERAEDFFEITDEHDRPLSETAQQELRQDLERRFGGESADGAAETAAAVSAGN
jgi:[protein-PII] uridylyltransferase